VLSPGAKHAIHIGSGSREIMLQQTRVAAVIPYYYRFLERFPDFRALASAPEAELLAYWAGLGYYYRARNMQQAAAADAGAWEISVDIRGKIRELPGVGDYTAAAVSSIAYDLPHAALDGNVLRGAEPCAGRSNEYCIQCRPAAFHGTRPDLLRREHPGAFNQAMMELGATICLPKIRSACCASGETLPCARERRARTNAVKAIRAANCPGAAGGFFWIRKRGRRVLWQRPPTSAPDARLWELPEAIHLPGATLGRSSAPSARITFHKLSLRWSRRRRPVRLGVPVGPRSLELASSGEHDSEERRGAVCCVCRRRFPVGLVR